MSSETIQRISDQKASFLYQLLQNKWNPPDTRHIKYFPEYSKSSLMKREIALFHEGENQKVYWNFSPANKIPLPEAISRP